MFIVNGESKVLKLRRSEISAEPYIFRSYGALDFKWQRLSINISSLRDV